MTAPAKIKLTLSPQAERYVRRAVPADTGKRPAAGGSARPKAPLGIDEQDPYKR